MGFEKKSQRQEGAGHTGSCEPLPSSARRLRGCPATLLGAGDPRTSLLTVAVHSWRGGGEGRGRLWSSRAVAEKDRLAPPQACGGWLDSTSPFWKQPLYPRKRYPLSGLAQGP